MTPHNIDCDMDEDCTCDEAGERPKCPKCGGDRLYEVCEMQVHYRLERLKLDGWGRVVDFETGDETRNCWDTVQNMSHSDEKFTVHCADCCEDVELTRVPKEG